MKEVDHIDEVKDPLEQSELKEAHIHPEIAEEAAEALIFFLKNLIHGQE